MEGVKKGLGKKGKKEWAGSRGCSNVGFVKKKK